MSSDRDSLRRGWGEGQTMMAAGALDRAPGVSRDSSGYANNPRQVSIPGRVRLPGRQVEARFRVRLNRFVALVNLGGEDIQVHVPNSGRLAELLLPGVPVFLTPQSGAHRKTAFDLSFAPIPGGEGWVCIDSRVPNRLVGETLLAFQEGNPL